MADNELKSLLEGLFSEIPTEAPPREAPPDSAVAQPAPDALARLERHVLHLQTASQVSRAASSILHLDELLPEVVNLIRGQLDFYYVGIFLVDEAQKWAVLQAGTGKAGQLMAEQGHQLEIGGDSMIGSCIAHQRARIALDIGDEAVRFNNPLLPQTRSEMALPLVSRGRVIGAMTIQSAQAEAFSEEDVTALQTMADQVANAIENARLFKEARQRAEQTQILLTVSEATASTLESTEVMQQIARAAAGVLDADTTAAYVLDPTGTKLVPVAGYHVPPAQLEMYQQTYLPVEGHLFVEEALKSRRTVSTSDTASDPRYDDELAGFIPARSALLTPMLVKDAVIGVLWAVWWKDTHHLTDEERGLVEGIVRQAAIAINSARLFEETRQRMQELAMLFDVSQALAGASLQAEEIAAIIVRQFVEAMGVPEASISLPDPEDESSLITIAEVIAAEGGVRPREDSQEVFRLADYPATARVMETLQPAVIHASDPDADPAELAYMQKYGTATLAILPLAVKGQAIGVVELESSDKELRFTPEQLKLATTLASQAAVALENARLFEETQQRMQELAMLFDVSQALAGASLQAEEIAAIIARKFVEVVGAPEASISLPDPEDRDKMIVVADVIPTEGGVRPREDSQEAFRLADYPATARVMETLQPAVIHASDPDADPAELAYMQKYGTATLAILPLAVKGQAIGVVELESSDKELRFTPEQLKLATTLASQTAMTLENARLFGEQQQASSLLSLRVGELDCLNDIGRKIDEAPRVRELLQWVTERIPPVMQYPDRCRVAIEFEDQVYGDVTAVDLPCQIVQGLHMGGQPAGRVYISYSEDRSFLDEESALLGDVARRLSGYIENRRLFQDATARARELSVLNEMARTLTAALDVDSLLNNLYHHTSHLLDTTNFYVAFYDPENEEISFPLSMQNGERLQWQPRRAGEGLTEYIVRTREALLIEEDIAAQLEALGIEMIGTVAQSWLGVPMLVGDQVLGVIAVQSYTTPRLYNEHHRDLLTAIASQAAIAVQNTWLLEETRLTAEEQAILRRVTETVSRTLSLDELLAASLEEALAALDFDAGLISLIDPDTGSLYMAAYQGLPEPMANKLQQDGLEGTLCDFVFQTGDTINLADVREGAPVDVTGVIQQGLLTYSGTPLSYLGQRSGTICFFNRTVRKMSNRELSLLEAVGRQIGVGIANSQLYQETQISAKEQAILHRVTETVSHTLSLEELLAASLEEALAALDFDAGLISLVDPDTGSLYLAAHQGLPEPMARKLQQDGLEGTLCDFVYQTGDTINLADVREGAPVDVTGVIQQGLLTYAGTPLSYLGQRTGTICFFNRTVRNMSNRELSLLEAIGHQIGVGVANSQLYQETQKALAEVEAAHRSYVRRGWQQHLRQHEMLLRSGFLFDNAQAESQDKVLLVPDLWRPEMRQALEQRSPVAATSNEGEEERTGLAVPITVRGQTLGVLGVEAPTGDHQWTEDDMALIEAVSDQLGQALESARLFADTQRRAERERLIGEITSKIRASTDIQDILETTAVELGQALGTSRAMVRLGFAESPLASKGRQWTIPEPGTREGQEVRHET